MIKKEGKIFLRCTEEDIKKLNYITEKGNQKNTSEVIRNCIRYAYQNLKDIYEPVPDKQTTSLFCRGSLSAGLKTIFTPKQ